ncbi:probable calcium-binding protein CML18 [Malania oleifera]|uniref:probable calcium-binding protein CML18 n=1 Tax=Malania oleifera TaxID=397392 RepID=UPI0025AEBE8D|nr:probable calcium-binding protein CML18 [Malania oleifera]XP_057970637.1 probable calcium-binding protein CML18 [Malania oleifera]XP_057970638.1 probable calcium-binding protein CML18 [Malania oleifera]
MLKMITGKKNSKVPPSTVSTDDSDAVSLSSASFSPSSASSSSSSFAELNKPKEQSPQEDADMEELQKMFNKYDANGDGKISYDELRAILCALGSDMSPNELQHALSEMDKDGDGYVDLAEFAEFHGGGTCRNRELRDAFKVFDQDKNGLISVKELHEVMKRLGEKVSLSDCRRMIRSVDSDGDGNVDFDEFKKMMSSR